MHSYSTFLILESILNVDPEFSSIIDKISDKNKIAKKVSDLFGKDIKTTLNYIKPGKSNDEVLSVNDSQVKRIIDSGLNPFDRSGNTSKVGRFVGQLLRSNGVPFLDKDIEQFVNIYKNAWESKFDTAKEERIRLVSGEDIRKWYHHSNYIEGGGTLNNSCMRYDQCQEYLDIYVDNSQCQLLIYLTDDDKLKSRSLVWKLEDGIYYQDRIYTKDDSDYHTMYNWFKEKYKDGLSYHKDDYEKHKITVKLDKFKYKFYPYMDSIYYLVMSEGIISNRLNDNQSQSGKHAVLRSTVGIIDMPGFRYLTREGEYVPSNECCYSRIYNDDGQHLETIYVRKSQCDQIYSGGWVLKEYLVLSTLYGKILKFNTEETEWGLVPKSELNDFLYTNGDIKKTPAKIYNNWDISSINYFKEDGRVTDVYCLTKDSIKTDEGEWYFKGQKDWLIDNKKILELYPISPENLKMTPVEDEGYYRSPEYSYILIKDAKYPVGVSKSWSNPHSSIREIETYKIQVTSESRRYCNPNVYNKYLFNNLTITDEIMEAYGDKYKDEMIEIDKYLCRSLSGYERKKISAKYKPTYDLNKMFSIFNNLLVNYKYEGNSIKDLFDKSKKYALESYSNETFMKFDDTEFLNILYYLYMEGFGGVLNKVSQVVSDPDKHSIYVALLSRSSPTYRSIYNSSDYFVSEFSNECSKTKEGECHLELFYADVMPYGHLDYTKAQKGFLQFKKLI